MFKFSQSSLEKLQTCDERLQRVFNEVIKYYDCTVICGHRGEKDQNEAFMKGYSKLRYPKSKHNSNPSKAIDCLPFPINWQDDKQHIFFAGFVIGIASKMGIRLRWGGDFNNDRNFSNDSFLDRPHFEIID